MSDEDELLEALGDDSSLATGDSGAVSDEREPAVVQEEEEEEGEGASLVVVPAAAGCQSSSLRGKVASLWSRLRETWFFKELVMMIRLALPVVSLILSLSTMSMDVLVSAVLPEWIPADAFHDCNLLCGQVQHCQRVYCSWSVTLIVTKRYNLSCSPSLDTNSPGHCSKFCNTVFSVY